ncbi:MAG: 2OG-Fe(II) oxygenase, partial [Myxococcota bacterium]|nr:2OG-Fe(II) oxygenase [Myxococcota bacterium]
MDLDKSVAAALEEMDIQAQRALYEEQGSVLMIEDFLPGDVLAQLLAGLKSVEGQAHRNYVPRQ